MDDLAKRVEHRIQLTSDGYRVYERAVENAFGCEVDYSMLVKIYGAPLQDDASTRYSPATCIGCRTTTLAGKPGPSARLDLVCRKTKSFDEDGNATLYKIDERFL